MFGEAGRRGSWQPLWLCWSTIWEPRLPVRERNAGRGEYRREDEKEERRGKYRMEKEREEGRESRREEERELPDTREAQHRAGHHTRPPRRPRPAGARIGDSSSCCLSRRRSRRGRARSGRCQGGRRRNQRLGWLSQWLRGKGGGAGGRRAERCGGGGGGRRGGGGEVETGGRRGSRWSSDRGRRGGGGRGGTVTVLGLRIRGGECGGCVTDLGEGRMQWKCGVCVTDLGGGREPSGSRWSSRRPAGCSGRPAAGRELGLGLGREGRSAGS